MGRKLPHAFSERQKVYPWTMEHGDSLPFLIHMCPKTVTSSNETKYLVPDWDLVPVHTPHTTPRAFEGIRSNVRKGQT